MLSSNTRSPYGWIFRNSMLIQIRQVNFENGNTIFEVASFESACKLNISKRCSNETIDKNQKCNQ